LNRIALRAVLALHMATGMKRALTARCPRQESDAKSKRARKSRPLRAALNISYFE
jgi:hypothetical protein